VIEGHEAPSITSRRKREAQEISGIRGSFLLDTFLWTSKEKYLAFGCENPIKPIVALATLKNPLTHKGRGML
jgi:hypothetical protein